KKIPLRKSLAIIMKSVTSLATISVKIEYWRANNNPVYMPNRTKKRFEYRSGDHNNKNIHMIAYTRNG
ncbi:MAG: hypothetical protein PVF83_12940, partial [Anaerolineales bacterium]